MNFELLKLARGGQSRRAQHKVTACAAVALALIGCGSESAPGSTDGTTTAPTTGVAGGAATTPIASSTTPTSSATTATATTAAAPATTQPATTTTTGTATTPVTPPATATQPVTPPAAGTTPPAMAGGSTTTPPAGTVTTPPAAEIELPVEMGKPTLFWLDITGNTIYTASSDGSGSKVFAAGAPLSAPDGVSVDPVGGFVYVLNMGSVLGGAGNGSLVRYKLDGSSPETIMPPGTMGFNTGKQVAMDKVNRKLYLGDREGSKVWRADMDGKNLETLVSGHMIQQVVGVAPDPIKKQFYFSDRNGKKIFRANMEMPAGKTHADRDDLELLYLDKALNAMPLDIELDVKDRMIYWTDRQQSKVFGMSMDMPAGMDGNTRTDVKAVASNLSDVIGLGYDHEAKQLYSTSSGTVSTFKADGSGLKSIGTGGVTGINFVKIP